LPYEVNNIKDFGEEYNNHIGMPALNFMDNSFGWEEKHEAIGFCSETKIKDPKTRGENV